MDRCDLDRIGIDHFGNQVKAADRSEAESSAPQKNVIPSPQPGSLIRIRKGMNLFHGSFPFFCPDPAGRIKRLKYWDRDLPAVKAKSVSSGWIQWLCVPIKWNGILPIHHRGTPYPAAGHPQRHPALPGAPYPGKAVYSDPPFYCWNCLLHWHNSGG